MNIRTEEVSEMCETCGCNDSGKPVRYECDCDDDCKCGMIEFDSVPDAEPYCCGQPMKRVR